MNEEQVLPTAAEQRLIAANALKARQRTRIYRISYGYRITGPFDPARFAAAVRRLAAGIPMLRAVFDEHPVVASELRVRDDQEVFFDHGPVEDPAGFLTRMAGTETSYTEGPLFQVDLARDGDAYLVLLSWDHSIVDAWSVSLCIRWLSEFYEGRAELPEGATRWASYARREADALLMIDQPGTFWRDQMAGARPATVATPTTPEPSGIADCVTISLVDKDFPRLCRGVGATPGTILLAGALATAAGYANPGDPRPITLPTMLANRDPQFQETIGLFMRTVLIQARPALERTVGDVRRNALREVGRCYRHRHESVVFLLEQYRDVVDEFSSFPLPLFAQLLDVPAREPSFGTCTVELAYHGFERTARFGVEIHMRPQPDGSVEGAFVYDQGQYRREEVELAARQQRAWIRRLVDPAATDLPLGLARDSLLDDEPAVPVG
jgi:hypothetical protein